MLARVDCHVLGFAAVVQVGVEEDVSVGEEDAPGHVRVVSGVAGRPVEGPAAGDVPQLAAATRVGVGDPGVRLELDARTERVAGV